MCPLGNFDSETGQLSFNINDKDAYPPGLYDVVLEVYMADYPYNFDFRTYNIELIDPCKDAMLEVEPIDSKLLLIGKDAIIDEI